MKDHRKRLFLLRQNDLDAQLGDIQAGAGRKRVISDQLVDRLQWRHLDAHFRTESRMVSQHDHLARRTDHGLFDGYFRDGVVRQPEIERDAGHHQEQLIRPQLLQVLLRQSGQPSPGCCTAPPRRWR